MTKAQAFVIEIARWAMIIGAWEISRRNGWIFVLAVVLSNWPSWSAARRGYVLPHDVVRLTVAGKAERVTW